MSEPLATFDLENIKDVYTFWEAEKRVVSSLKERLLNETQSVDVESVAALARERQAGHWLSGPGRDLLERRAIADAYDAIVAATELFALHLRGWQKEGSRSQKVSVQVLGTNHKIMTPKYRFEVIQTEAVGERRKRRWGFSERFYLKWTS
ncbi:MAG: hypothetical protein KAY24_13025 [Candidatus Eisenbacteria sp.]|nr:hypothetical protein [Candidatus Eisenbacteria bacterium]